MLSFAGIPSSSVVDLTPTNWRAGVNITVAGVRNYAADGAVPYVITAAVALSADSRYISVRQLPALCLTCSGVSRLLPINTLSFRPLAACVS